MYLRRIRISSIKNFETLTWELDEEDPLAGWHVLLGDNGAGKSTLIRAVALALMGQEGAPRTQSDFTTWVRQNNEVGSIHLLVEHDVTFDSWSGKGRTSTRSISLGIEISNGKVKVAPDSDPNAERTIWGDTRGWFSASFGPFRRFTGGDQIYSKLFYSYPKVARHLCAFNEGVALTETLEWLKELRFKQLETEKAGAPSAEAELLTKIIALINQDDFLPNGARLQDVTSKGVIFKDAQGNDISLEEASDGHRSILSMMMELIRQMAVVYGPDKIFSEDGASIQSPGIVLIDEIDAHLHPRWQRRIGHWLGQHFPHIQFIVTTHSPLICQGAIRGSVFQLPRPGQEDPGGRIRGEPLSRLLYGNVLEAYGSGAFGEGIERSEAGQEWLAELSALNVEARRRRLNEKEEARRQELLGIFNTEEL